MTFVTKSSRIPGLETDQQANLVELRHGVIFIFLLRHLLNEVRTGAMKMLPTLVGFVVRKNSLDIC